MSTRAYRHRAQCSRFARKACSRLILIRSEGSGRGGRAACNAPGAGRPRPESGRVGPWGGAMGRKVPLSRPCVLASGTTSPREREVSGHSERRGPLPLCSTYPNAPAPTWTGRLTGGDTRRRCQFPNSPARVVECLRVECRGPRTSRLSGFLCAAGRSDLCSCARRRGGDGRAAGECPRAARVGGGR
jgi:hypothetical protein